MARRSARLRAANEAGKKSPWGCIVMAVLPLVLLLGWMALSMLGGSGPGSPEAKARVAQDRARQEAVAESMRAGGADYTYSSSGGTITLPAAHALSVTTREAMELALSAYQRTGKPVKVKTHAGQVLAEAP